MSNLNELKPIISLNPFARFCCTIGNLPSSYMASLTYEEQLLWFCDFLQNTVIPAVNNNAECVKELQELYVKLKNYVDNYFENLDVQNEINNKLDEMAESGELENIIGEFLRLNSLLCFDNVQDMKESVNLIDGSFAKTLGYYSKGDGGSSYYKIRKITNKDIVDEITIISLLNDNLIAEFINNKTYILPEQFGCKGDNINDDTLNFQEVINYGLKYNTPIFAFKNYKITSTLFINGINLYIKSNHNAKLVSSEEQFNNYTFNYTGSGFLFDSLNTEFNNCIFENISIKGLKNNNAIHNVGYRNIYKNCCFYNLNTCIYFGGIENTWRGENNIEGCFFDDFENAIFIQSKNYADSYINFCTFLTGNYAINGSFNAWTLNLSHDYSKLGLNLFNCANSQLTNNYFDKSSSLPFINIQKDIPGSVIITNNKFLTGDNIEQLDSFIKINNNVSSQLIISNNGSSGTRYDVSFVKFTGSQNISLSATNNTVIGQTNKDFENLNPDNFRAFSNISQLSKLININGTVNTNIAYINNGIAFISLDISNATKILGVLPFTPSLSISVPIYSVTNNTWGVAIINTNKNITIPDNMLGNRVLINASYLVNWNGIRL